MAETTDTCLINAIDETKIDNEIFDSKMETKQTQKSHYCYILRNSYQPHKNRTYNGYTVNPKHRVRQHNQEIKGGAIYTKLWGNKNWEMYCLLKGFPDHSTALQCEWKIKHPAKKRTRPLKYNSPSGRIIGLNEILQLDKWTSKSEIDVKDHELKLWILNDYIHLLENVPENIEVIGVDKIDLDNV